MGFLDNLKSATQLATARAKEELGELQKRREISQAYGELGHKAFDLVESGQVTHAELSSIVARIKSLQAELDALATAGAASAQPPSAEPPASS